MSYVAMLPAMLSKHANGFRGWRGTDEAARFVARLEAEAPIDLAYDDINLAICQTAAERLADKRCWEHWESVEEALVRAARAIYAIHEPTDKGPELQVVK